MLHAGVLDDLGQRIAWGEIRPGDVLTTAQLEAEYEVSRTVVREAVRVLESMRLVEPKRHVGIRVRPRTEWNALDIRLIQWNLAGPGRKAELGSLMELRQAIEPVAARLAAARATQQDREELLSLARRLRKLGQRGLGSSQEYLDVDIAFHRLVVRCSGNEMFAGVLGDVIDQVLAGRTRLGLSPDRPAPKALDLHEIAADAILHGHGDDAEAAIRDIVVEARTAALHEGAATEPGGDRG